ncbi:hypothetical protein QMK61_03010 [Fulvimonas sp. R45]|uniref:hypothetical protein n=1 Tax=Fulvimonas sp. R45 TaxID=3045937 RepID=UPI00266039D1|nr:hypothetical protein [Fulvimonas sp. R45]MDO1527790.1 hypothetical protein [Fulvimonas sp. R45]
MNATSEKTFLVFSGGNDRAVLGFLRALRQCGQHAAIVARTRADRILHTRFRKDVHCVRETPELSLDVFSRCLNEVRRATGRRTFVLLPSTEYFNAFLFRHRTDIEGMGCDIPLVEAPLYGRLTNKSSATRLFSSYGIAVPSERSFQPGLEAPIVAKPNRNLADSGGSLYPQLLLSPFQITAFLANHDPADYFFQEFITGESLYFFFYLPRCGGPAVVWSQRNLLQQPNGKSMLMAEPAYFHQSGTASRILKILRDQAFWGLGMVEVIRDNGRDVFIEMNPRIWGPIQFCIDQGQPLLQAFVGDALASDTKRFAATTSTRHKRKRYFWLGGLAETLASGTRPVWHVPPRSLVGAITTNLWNDVYLRADSWRCFLHELSRSITEPHVHETPKN